MKTLFIWAIIGIVAFVTLYLTYSLLFATQVTEVAVAITSESESGPFTWMTMLVFGGMILGGGILLSWVVKVPEKVQPYFFAVLGVGSILIVVSATMIYNAEGPKTARELLDTIQQEKALAQGQSCDNGACDVAEDGLPIVDGSRQSQPFDIPLGEAITFWAVGKVKVSNGADYCLNNSRPKAFYRDYSDDGRTYYITPKSGKPTLVTMTSKPMSRCS